jgi:hypothetical protein
MKQSAVTLILSLFTLITYGQTESNKSQSLFFEIAGSGGLGSINYEKHFFHKSYTEYTWRAGLSFAPIDKNNGTGIVFPIMVNSYIGKKSHKLEFGIGQGITITTKGSFFALTTAAIGYRYQPRYKNWFCRVTYTPLISYLVDFQIQQWGGISIGYSLE